MRIADGADDVLTRHGGRSLARFGNIHVVSLPLKQLGPISHDARVLRIEANRMNKLLNDSMPLHLNATKAYEGIGLPQAFTGKGVVVGVMDVGFDLTHPTFYSRDTTDYRIRRLWDMISADTIGSELYVGRDYRTKEELLQLGCCRDGRDNSHGTHTTGTAAGSGYDSKYGGMAPESDICLVANAVSDDIAISTRLMSINTHSLPMPWASSTFSTMPMLWASPASSRSAKGLCRTSGATTSCTMKCSTAW